MTRRIDQTSIASRRTSRPDLFRAGLSFSKTLRGHASCINASAWSSAAGGGRLLATGGDDTTVKLWNVHNDDNQQMARSFEPITSLIGHRRTIFKLAWSPDDVHIVSGSTDETVRRFDVNTGQCQIFPGHQDTIRDVSTHPTNSNLVLSASEDGMVHLNDARLPSDTVAGAISAQAVFTGAAYSPRVPDLFVTTDSKGKCYLRDTRMAFSHVERTGSSFRGGVVRRFVTTVLRRHDPHLSTPETSSVAFDSRGEKFTVIFSNFYPVIYSPSDDYPLAVCCGSTRKPLEDSGNENLESEGKYSNCCTIKHGSFGGSSEHGAEYYATGSDDFRAYVWRVPDVEALRERRIKVVPANWPDGPEDELGFTKSMKGERVVPVLLNDPAFTLTGHKTIVNSALFHPNLPLAVTTGVESFARLHNSAAASGFERTPREVRIVSEEPSGREKQFLRAMRVQLQHVADQLYSGDDAAIVYFDNVVREEGGTEPYMFTARAWGLKQPSGDWTDSSEETDENSEEEEKSSEESNPGVSREMDERELLNG